MARSRGIQRSEAPAWLVWAALIVIYVVWGSTYLAIRLVVETMPPLLAAGVRFVVAGGILYAALLLRGGLGRVRVSRAELGGSALVGMALLLFGNGLVSLGEREVPSALAALIIGIVPLNVLILRAIAGERIPRLGLLGVALGFAGLAVLVVPRGIAGTVAVGGMALLVVSSIAWSAGSFASRRLPLPRDPLISTALQLLLGGTFLLLAGVVTGELGLLRPEAFSTASVVSLVYLITFGSLLAYTAYTWLLQNAPIAKIATYAYVNPVVAVLLGWLVLHEEVNLSMIVGALMIVGSVAFIIWTESRPGRRRVPDELTAGPGPSGAPPPVTAAAPGPSPTRRGG